MDERDAIERELRAPRLAPRTARGSRSASFVQAMACPEPTGFHEAGAIEKNTKGAFGQALLQKYFEYAGWAVSATGIETVVDHIMQQHGLDKGQLNRLPDLIVSKVAGSRSNPLSHPLGQAFYVEVKTWTTWPEEGVDMGDYSRFGTVLLVWVGPNGLLGTWLAKPPGDSKPTVAADPSRVMLTDFTQLAVVGSVSLSHCSDLDCQRRLRQSFDAVAKTLAAF